jgi:SRF-type transcription factor (DNA-binding and dimerisation domain)
MIRKRTRTIFNKCYELYTKTSLQVVVVTYDEIQNLYYVFRTLLMFMAAIIRKIASLYPYHK